MQAPSEGTALAPQRMVRRDRSQAPGRSRRMRSMLKACSGNCQVRPRRGRNQVEATKHWTRARAVPAGSKRIVWSDSMSGRIPGVPRLRSVRLIRDRRRTCPGPSLRCEPRSLPGAARVAGMPSTRPFICSARSFLCAMRRFARAIRSGLECVSRPSRAESSTGQEAQRRDWSERHEPSRIVR